MNTVLLAILNTLWQSVAIAAAVWLLLKLARGTNAATRHAVWWATLAVVVLLPIIPARAPVPSPVFHTAAESYPQAAAASDAPVEISPAATVPRTSGIELPGGSWTLAVFGFWAIACLLQLARTAWSYRYLRTLKRQATPAAPELRRNFDAWTMSCGVHRPVRLLVSTQVSSPMAVGFREPAVILPPSLLDEFGEADLDHVLLHELAHVARRDDWTNLAARLAGSFLVFHPAAMWILRRIDREREISCDDWVVTMTGSARPYATSLTRLFELCRSRNRMLLASGMATRASHLGERIEMLLRSQRVFAAKASVTRIAFSVLALLLAGLAFSQAPRWLAFAQDPPPTPPAPIQTAPAPAAEPAPPLSPEPPAPVAAPEPSADQRPAQPSQPAPPVPPAPPASPSPGFLAALVAAGYGNLTVDQIIDLKNAGLSPQFLTGMAEAGWGHPSAGELIELAHSGVSPEYAHAMRDSGIAGLTLKDVIQLRQQGARPETVREIHALGFGPYSARDVILFTNHGVRPELFRALKETGWKNLTTSEIVDAHNAGLRGVDIREARQYGENLTLKQVIRLKQAGVL